MFRSSEHGTYIVITVAEVSRGLTGSVTMSCLHVSLRITRFIVSGHSQAMVSAVHRTLLSEGISHAVVRDG
jgi:hypothetical protein